MTTRLGFYVLSESRTFTREISRVTEYWKKMVEENRDWLMDDEKYKVVSNAKDES